MKIKVHLYLIKDECRENKYEINKKANGISKHQNKKKKLTGHGKNTVCGAVKVLNDW